MEPIDEVERVYEDNKPLDCQLQDQHSLLELSLQPLERLVDAALVESFQREVPVRPVDGEG